MSVQADCLDTLRDIADCSFDVLTEYYRSECNIEKLISELLSIRDMAIEEYNRGAKTLGWNDSSYNLLEELEEKYKEG